MSKLYIEENIPIGHKGQPLKDTTGAKRSINNAFTPEAPKAPYTPIITQPPDGRYYCDQRYSILL